MERHNRLAEGRYDAASQQLFLIAQVAEPYRTQLALRAGLFVRADITGNTLSNVFVLPRHVVRRGNEVALLVQEGARKILKRQPISVLWRDQKVIVTADLQAGDKVIATPVDYATNGQQLREPGDPLPDPPPTGKGKGKGKNKNNGKAPKKTWKPLPDERDNRPVYRNSVAANLLMVFIILMGSMASSTVYRRGVPRFRPGRDSNPRHHRGATPEQMEESIVILPENAVADLPGIEEVQSPPAKAAAPSRWKWRAAMIRVMCWMT